MGLSRRALVEKFTRKLHSLDRSDQLRLRARQGRTPGSSPNRVHRHGGDAVIAQSTAKIATNPQIDICTNTAGG